MRVARFKAVRHMFPGFTPSDFAAYEERKWASNAFTLERMKVRDKFTALQTHLALGSEDLAAHLSDEHPNIMNHKRVDAQWLYFMRSPAQAAELNRFLEKTELQPDKIFNLAPQDKHAALALTLSQKGVTFGLIAHPGAWVDRKNLAAKLEQSWNREKLKQLLSELSADLLLGFDDEVAPAHDMELDGIASLGEMIGRDERSFSVGRTLTPDEAQAAGENFAGVLAQAFTALLPVYNFLTWSRSNDHIQVGETLQKQKAEKRKNDTVFKVGDKVKVLGGLFAGKDGTIAAIDSKTAKVQVGGLAVTVASVDLARA